MSSRKNQPERVAESIAYQNKVVSRSIDAMVENISSCPDAELRSDWNEICLTTEMVLMQDLLLGDADLKSSPQTGSLHGRKNSNESKPKTNKETT